MADKQHVRIPYETEAQQSELAEFYDYGDASSEGSDWEDAGSASDGGETHEDAEFVLDEPYDAGFELILPSGGVAGHRSLQKYYRQTPVTLPERPGHKAVRLSDHRSPGIGVRAADKMVKQAWAQEHRAQSKAAKGRKHMNNQAHFRDPLLQ